jgi:hypothetical protein
MSYNSQNPSGGSAMVDVFMRLNR